MTKIEWTNETWNPTTGCDKVSQGCKNCYAATVAKRFWGERKFTDVKMHEDRLTIPMKWKQPKMIFVDSMSDLFHDDVAVSFIDKVFTVIAHCPQHTFQILTKRPERLKDYFQGRVENLAQGIINAIDSMGWLQISYERAYELAEMIKKGLPNVWLGVSCENQATADERIPLLLQVPAAVRFLSCEPLLGEIDLTKIDVQPTGIKNKTWIRPAIHWVIVGGESGHGARPMHPDWVRSLRDQCQAADVPFFFKQWGEWMPTDSWDANLKSEIVLNPDGEEMVVTTNPKAVVMRKVGKSKAGRTLDGVEHNEFPKQLN